ncbi:dnaJ1 [Symbiodinium necroappetens]|uniref:DnaJ1 protein n=1 Tax=Symbiodinium necroappetens TaxID=1628268 RepID=A0A812UDA2_9DINO|nr:dnaJ1 [Symbiodinium necroappetens]
MRRTPTPRRARGKSQPKSRPAHRPRAQTPRRSSTPVGKQSGAEAPAPATLPEVSQKAVPSATPPAGPAGPADPAPRTGCSPSTSSKEVQAEAPNTSKVETKAAPGPSEPQAQEAAAASQVAPDGNQEVQGVRELPQLPAADADADAPKQAIPKAPEVPKPKAAPARKYSTPRPDLNKEHQQGPESSAPKDRPEGEPKSDAEPSAEKSVSKALDTAPNPPQRRTRSFEPIAPTAGTAPLCAPVSVTLRTAGLGKSADAAADVQKITVAAPSPAKAKAFARTPNGDHPLGAQEETPRRAESNDSCKSEKLAIPTKNKERLGMLQCGGCKRAPVRSSWREGLGGAVAVPTLPTSWATDLPDSGIEAGAIADWMEGRLSWHGCFCRILDALRRYTPDEGEGAGKVAEDAAADMGRQAEKVLAEHIELMSQSSLLALLAGGAPSMRSDARTLEGLLPAQPKEKPAQALANAHQWFIGGIGLGPGGMRDPGGGSLQMALAFRRLQLRAHPAADGSQQMLLDASVFLETLRAASLAQCGCRLPRHDDVGREMTDQELLLLLDIKSRRDDGALETEGFLEGAKAQRLAAYARALGEIRTDLKALQKVLSLDNARQLLGLSHSASTEDLAKAYRRKARELHPDRQGETSTGAFQALRGAYELLQSHKDGIARASQVDVVPQIGPGETVVRGVEFKLPKHSGADELALKADLVLRSAQAFGDMQLLMRKPPSRAAPRAQTVPGRRTLEPVPEADPQEENEAAESGKPAQPEKPGGAVWRASSRSGRSRLALHCAGTVNMTAEEAARVGMSASATQAQVLPLLLAVLDVSTTMPEELFGNVTRNAKKCMSQMKSALSLGNEACDIGWKASNQAMEYSDSEAFWEPRGESGKTLGDEVMEMASQAALNCAAAVMVLSDGFEAAQRLAASLQQALNVRAKTMGDEWPERKRREEKPEPEGNTEAEKRLRLHRMAGDIFSSNLEMLQWQTELREAVLCRPHLLNPVSVWEKEALFCLASEVLEGLQGRLSEVEVDQGMEPLEAVFSVTFAAASFRGVASPPSIEARLLRLAALVHAALLRKMLEEFFSTCLSDLGSRGHPMRIVEILRRRCNAALAEFTWLQADAPVRTYIDS